MLRSSFSLSIIVHGAAIVLLAYFVGRQPAVPAPAKLTWIEMAPIPSAEAKNPVPKVSEAQKRIVQTTDGRRTKTAAPDAFQGEHTQTVDRQSVNRDQHITAPMQAKAAAQTKSQPRPEAPAPRSPEKPSPQSELAKFGMPILPSADKILRAQPEHEAATAQTGGLPQDYVKGLKEGEVTALNTREYVFFGYFQRIRGRLDHAWSGVLRDRLIKLYRSGRQLASDMDHTTRVLVTLNATGEIVRVQIVEESGTRDLDDAAVKAFNQAGPFPNPPRGLVDATGNIQIRWDFVLKT